MVEKLLPHEIESAAWKRIQEHFDKRLETHRRKNDGELSSEETAKLRGRIAEVKYLLSLGERTES